MHYGAGWKFSPSALAQEEGVPDAHDPDWRHRDGRGAHREASGGGGGQGPLWSWAADDDGGVAAASGNKNAAGGSNEDDDGLDVNPGPGYQWPDVFQLQPTQYVLAAKPAMSTLTLLLMFGLSSFEPADDSGYHYHPESGFYYHVKTNLVRNASGG